MYCAKCGNLLKKEDNFCSICGTPSNTESKRINKGNSGYGFVRDDDPIELDDFFKFDEKKEKTLKVMDRELDDIKARATQNLLRRSNENASVRRAARMAKRATESKNNLQRSAGISEKSVYETNSDLDFDDEIFQTTVQEPQKPLIGRRNQKELAKAKKEKKILPVEPPEVSIPSDRARVAETDHTDDEKQSKIQEEQVQTIQHHNDPPELKQQAKRKHLFRENTIEVPNIFDEIAQSMERARQQERESGYSENTPEIENEDMTVHMQEEPFEEGVFPLPPKQTKEKSIEAVLPDVDVQEGVFSINKETEFSKPEMNEQEGVFPIGQGTVRSDADFQEGVFPISRENESDNTEIDPQEAERRRLKRQELFDLPGENEEEPVYNLRKASRSQNKDYAQSFNNPNYEYFRYRSKKKKVPNALVCVLAILIIIFAGVSLKMLLSGDSPALVFQQIKGVFAISPEGLDKDPADITSNGALEQQESGNEIQDAPGQAEPTDLKTQGATDPKKMLQYVLSTGVNKNITEVKYNPDLKYNQEKTYKTADINTSVPITENLFYEEGGKKYYYTECVMNTMIQFNSLWVDYVNNNDKAVLDVIKKGSKAYDKTMAFSFSGMKETFVEFEIGEIRKSKDGFFVWTKEKINVVKDNVTNPVSYDWIYYLEVSGNKSIKIINYVKE